MTIADRSIERFAIRSDWLSASNGLRLDASFYNPRLARAMDALGKSGMELRTLEALTERIYIPPRFKRNYVQPEHGVPFVQGAM